MMLNLDEKIVGVKGELPETLRWVGGSDGYLELIDQRVLPDELVYIQCKTSEEVFLAIKELKVRGAPAIGVSAGYGMVIAARESKDPIEGVKRGAEYLSCARPTAVNLFWAIDRISRLADELKEVGLSREDFLKRLLEEAKEIHREDIEMCRSIGKFGAGLIGDGFGVLTHCNAGSLATSYYGTALSVMYHSYMEGKKFRVYVDETRPVLQGARLTYWELSCVGIDATLICDNMAGWAMKNGYVDVVVVGADRIARNGDTANKIGTYSLAVLANKHKIPFYIAAPVSTFDFNIESGKEIPIEQRSAEEVKSVRGNYITCRDANCWNPAFDVTPAELITGFITDKGIFKPTDISKLLDT